MLTPKFVRAHAIPQGANGFNWFFKLIYEFWGFCVNGDTNLTQPGGFSPNTGVFQMPWSPVSSSAAAAGLLASGTDGYTSSGMPFFNTINQTAFSSSYANKWLVTWKSGSTSTDDSVYQITQWINSASVRLNVLQGGTPYSASLHPSLTDRDQIYWRVVDFAPAAAMSVLYNTSSLILQFNAAADVNPNQSLSQIRLRMSKGLAGYGFGATAIGVGYTLSPSGTWHGNSGFDSGSYSSGSIISGTYVPTGTFTQAGNLLPPGFFSESLSEVALGTTNGGYWFNGADNPAYITLIGSQDFLISHYRSAGNSAASGFHIEIPQRTYPQATDPNPIAMMGWGVDSVNSTNGASHYAGGFYMHNPPDNTLINYKGMARRFFGSTENNAPGFQTNGRYNGAFYNTYQNKFVFMDVALANSTTGEHQMVRARLRRVRILPPIIPQFERVGNLGEWVYVESGVMWPWDNSLLPYNLFLGGN
jgi:hypothetical protein